MAVSWCPGHMDAHLLAYLTILLTMAAMGATGAACVLWGFRYWAPHSSQSAGRNVVFYCILRLALRPLTVRHICTQNPRIRDTINRYVLERGAGTKVEHARPTNA